MDELKAWLMLSRVPGLHGGTLQPLLQQFGSVAAFVKSSPATWRSSGLSTANIEALAHSEKQIESDLRWLDAPDHHFIGFGSNTYPELLTRIADPPVGLFVRGNPDVLSLPQLAIVGARNPTPTGRENAHDFAAHLARCGLTITSGLALGIDAASHEGALHGAGTTIAVCGTGLDTDYPRANRELADAISRSGALISEFPLGTPPLKANFPRRNRLISGLSVGTLVVEAAVQSGSLITARMAAEQGREVFAIPGSIHNPLARGCHQLIRQGAKLVETADDIFAELRALAGTLRAATPAAISGRSSVDSRPVLDKDYEILLDALGFEPASVDSLIERTGLKADEVASMLLILELEGRIEPYPGGLYVRRATKATQ
ncbi:MAG TPA: DNA-processing protein DprA [Steroidobacteraceae bacterium]|nr:DNA-processing protein DprA [Steroidobacteraceae bacterium]